MKIDKSVIYEAAQYRFYDLWQEAADRAEAFEKRTGRKNESLEMIRDQWGEYMEASCKLKTAAKAEESEAD